MRILIATTLVLAALSAPAFAAAYPIDGAWGVVANRTDKAPINCAGKRVIEFSGNQRTDSGGGVPVYRNVSVTPAGSSRYAIVDEFSNGQVSGARVNYTLIKTGNDDVDLQLQQGGTLKMQRCK